MSKDKVFRAEVKTTYPEWWRYNVFMTAACFDAEDKIADYLTLTDKIYEPGDGREIRHAPENYDPVRPLMIETPPCDHLDIYVYVIANTFPASDTIKESPPFEIELVVTKDGGKPETYTYDVNQWGGLTLKRSLA